MKTFFLIAGIICSYFAGAQDYLPTNERTNGYIFINAGSFSVASNMGSRSSFGFGTQFLRKNKLGFGVEAQSAIFQPSAGVSGYSKKAGLFTKYYLSDSFSLSLDLGAASQVRYTTAITQGAASYGYYGASLCYDYHGKNDLLGFALDLQAINVVNNPAQTWLGGKFSVKLWFD